MLRQHSLRITATFISCSWSVSSVSWKGELSSSYSPGIQDHLTATLNGTGFCNRKKISREGVVPLIECQKGVVGESMRRALRVISSHNSWARTHYMAPHSHGGGGGGGGVVGGQEVHIYQKGRTLEKKTSKWH